MRSKAINFDDLKPYMQNYLQNEYGVADLRKNFPCPVCGGGQKTPCCSYDPRTERIKCFSCGWGGDVINLVETTRNLSPREAAEYISENYTAGVELKPTHKEKPVQEAYVPAVDYGTYIIACSESEKAASYFAGRGLSLNTVKQFNLGYDEAKNQAIIPYNNFFYIGRNDYAAQYKYFIPKDSTRPHPYNHKALFADSSEPVFVVEGEINALSLIEIGLPAVAIGSAVGWRSFSSYLQQNNIKKPLIIMFDNDEAGTKAQHELLNSLPEWLAVLSVDFPFMSKDINDVLREDREALHNVMHSIYTESQVKLMLKTEVQPNIIESSNGIFALESFMGKVKGYNFKPITTGFNQLDTALGGGFYNGLVIISAAPSEGKSTISMQLVENIAEQQGRDILIFSYEMSKEQLLARSLSRLSYEVSGKDKAKAMTALEIMQGDKWEALASAKIENLTPATDRYKNDIAPNVYIFDDCQPTKEAILARVEEYKQHKLLKEKGKEYVAPIILIDYLQLLDTGTKDFVSGCKDITLALKQYAIKNETLVIAISSVNRESQKTGTSLTSGYGSSFTEYSSDYVLTLDFTAIKKKQDVSKEELKQAEIRDMSITIQKNRMGATGGTIEMYYAAAYNHFEEKTEEQALADAVGTKPKRKV